MNRMATRSLNTLLLLLVAGGASGVASATDPPRLGSRAPDFTLKMIGGKPVRLASLTARSPTVLVVLRGFPGYQWPICTRQVAELIGRADDIKRARGHVLLVYPGPAAQLTDHALEFLGRRKLPDNFTLVVDPDYHFTNAYGLRWDAPQETAYPATFVIDTQNRVRFALVSKSHGGRAGAEEILKSLREIR